MKLWGGRFKGEADALFARFNASFAFDRRLIEADIEGSLAQADALREAGIDPYPVSFTPTAKAAELQERHGGLSSGGGLY